MIDRTPSAATRDRSTSTSPNAFSPAPSNRTAQSDHPLAALAATIRPYGSTTYTLSLRSSTTCERPNAFSATGISTFRQAPCPSRCRWKARPYEVRWLT